MLCFVYVLIFLSISASLGKSICVGEIIIMFRHVYVCVCVHVCLIVL